MPKRGDEQANVFHASTIFIEYFVERLEKNEAVDWHSNQLVNVVGAVRVGDVPWTLQNVILWLKHRGSRLLSPSRIRFEPLTKRKKKSGG